MKLELAGRDGMVYYSYEIPAWADAVRVSIHECPLCNPEPPHELIDFDFVKNDIVVPMVDWKEEERAHKTTFLSPISNRDLGDETDAD